MYHIYAVNQGIETSEECTKPVYMAFIDYEKAFDSVNTAAVLEAIKDHGIEETYIRLLEDIYKEFSSRITPHKQNDKFPIRNRVIQGYPIFPRTIPSISGGGVYKA